MSGNSSLILSFHQNIDDRILDPTIDRGPEIDPIMSQEMDTE